MNSQYSLGEKRKVRIMDTDNDGEFYPDMNRAMTGVVLATGILIGGLLLYKSYSDNNRNQNVPVEVRR